MSSTNSMKKIPLLDLQRHLKPLKPDILRRWSNILRDSEFTHGKETSTFEKNFAKLAGTRYAVGVRSGTASLLVALKAAGIKLGDEVITTPMTFSATADSIILSGGTPVFVDVLPATGNIDPNKIEAAITKKTKAILIVHLYGVPCEMDQVCHIAKKHNLLLIEDASHAHGSLYKNKPIGSFGIAGCFSLYPSKTLGSLGNAGVITSSNAAFIKHARAYAHHGILDPQNKYLHQMVGYNELIDNLQSAALNTKMQLLNKAIVRKRTIATAYNKVFTKHNLPGMVWESSAAPSLYVYAVQIKKRKSFVSFMTKKGVGTGVYYPIPLHLQPSLKFLGYRKGDFPHAELFASQTVSLPLFPELTKTEVTYICKTLEDYLTPLTPRK